MTTSSDELTAICSRVELDPRVLAKHRARVLVFCSANGEMEQSFDIQDACRIDNGGIIESGTDLNHLVARSGLNDRREFIAFTPAAGAASRYLEPLKGITNVVSGGDIDRQGFQDFLALLPEGAADWPLPENLERFIKSGPDSQFTEQELASLFETVLWPKALYPCNAKGQTYLDAKHLENLAFKSSGIPIRAEVFVAPTGRAGLFSSSAPVGSLMTLPRTVLEQSGALNTLRFAVDGSPIIESDGRPSIVAAGHGALVQLFSEVGEKYPEADYLLIRNIDNVIGTRTDSVTAVSDFCRTASAVISAVDVIRAKLGANDAIDDDPAYDAFARAVGFLEGLGRGPAPMLAGKHDDASLVSTQERLIWIQAHVFHSSEAMEILSHLKATGDYKSELKRLFSRPVNVLGQVPNLGNDVGGTPVFVVRPDGVREKLCIEVVHAQREAVDEILRRPEKATHFNPVFVASELKNLEVYDQEHPYWACVKKRHRGLEVCYHESFLYEILGSSSLSNVVFLEIPRLLFNPHKTLSDAASSRIEV